MGELERLGLVGVINATGPWTRMGNTAPGPAVLRAMEEMAGIYIPFVELQDAASRAIAEATGSEAGYATPGAAAAITLATAAFVAGEDAERMRALPRPEGPPHTVVLFRQHRTYYDVAIRAAGAVLRVVDAPADASGARALDALAEAIDTDVAAVFYDATGLPYRDQTGVPDLEPVIARAHDRGVPVLVDASMALPPVENLRSFVAAGADAVAFSGGKAIGGPPASGFLACRRALLRSIALQHQDVDIHTELTGAPHPVSPFMGIGRGYKVGKEQVAGLLAALSDYALRDHDGERRLWHARLDMIEEAVRAIPGVTRRRIVSNEGRAPYLMLGFAGPLAALQTTEVSRHLLAGTPRVFVAAHRGNLLWVGPENLREGEAETVARRLVEVIAGFAADPAPPS